MADQPEALFLADAMNCVSDDGCGYCLPCRTAAELRRQHAEIESLKAERDEDRRREYGYSQQVVDALTNERDALRVERDAILSALKGVMYWDNGKSEWQDARAAIDAATKGGGNG